MAAAKNEKQVEGVIQKAEEPAAAAKPVEQPKFVEANPVR